MAEVAILKTVKSLYLSNRLTDFDDIWHADADWPPTGDKLLKFFNFSNMAAVVIFKNHTNPDITTRNRQIFAKSGMIMQNVSLKRPDRYRDKTTKNFRFPTFTPKTLILGRE